MDQRMIASQPQLANLYRLAGVMALLIVAAGLLDMLTSLGVDAQDNRSITITEWFTLFQTDRFAAFSRLGVINILTLSCGIPIYLAFMQANRQRQPALTVLAASLFLIGTAVYLSSNTVFSLFAISQQYAIAPEAEKPLLEAAGSALLMQGADLTPGTFAGLFFTQVAGVLMSITMLRGSMFGRWTGALGLAGFGLMIVFFLLTAFFPAYYNTAMLVAAPGGLLLMAYQILVARCFFRQGR